MKPRKQLHVRLTNQWSDHANKCLIIIDKRQKDKKKIADWSLVLEWLLVDVLFLVVNSMSKMEQHNKMSADISIQFTDIY